MHKRLYLAFGLAVAALSACNESPTDPEEEVPCDPFLLSFGAAGADTVTTPEGLRYVEIKAGTGATAAAMGNVALVNYSGYYADNNQIFESSCDPGFTAIAFQLGHPQIIEGFSLGVVGMRTGGVRRVILSSELGYGDGEERIFDLHLVELN